jgi:hypothetical protein
MPCRACHRLIRKLKKGEQSMTQCVKRSIGKLRPATRHKPKSPHLTGKLSLQRATFQAFAKEFQESNSDEISCNIAAWLNRDVDGLFLATELSPLFNTDVPEMTMEEFFRTLDHESEK